MTINGLRCKAGNVIRPSIRYYATWLRTDQERSVQDGLSFIVGAGVMCAGRTGGGGDQLRVGAPCNDNPLTPRKILFKGGHEYVCLIKMVDRT